MAKCLPSPSYTLTEKNQTLSSPPYDVTDINESQHYCRNYAHITATITVSVCKQ